MTDILNPANPDLISHWTMGNIANGMLIDETGSHDGLMTGATAIQWDLGNAINFDGSKDNVKFSPRIPVGAEFTFSTFFLIRSPNKTEGHWLINSRSDTATGTNWQLIYYPQGAAVGLAFQLWNTDGQSFLLDSGVAPQDGTPYHCAVTVGNGTMSIYIDRVLKAQASYTGDIRAGSSTTVFGERGWMLGLSGTQPGDFDGALGITRFYNGIRSQAEIDDLYFEPRPYEVKGFITIDGQPLSADVRIYNASTGDLLSTVTSDASGSYWYPTLTGDQVYVMPVPPSGYRPLVHGPINPALRSQ